MKYLYYILFVALFLISCGKEEKLTFDNRFYSNTGCSHCAQISLEVPEAISNRKISETINNTVNEEVISLLSFEEEQSVTDIPSAIASFNRGYKDLKTMFPDETIPWEARIEGKIAFENKDLLTIELNSYIFTGGAHGYGSTRYLNFDKNKAKELSRDELFKNAEKFESFVEGIFRTKQGIPEESPINSTGLMFEQDRFYLPENIGFTQEGLILLYNPYEVASYADGSIELTLPYEEVAKYLAIRM